MMISFLLQLGNTGQQELCVPRSPKKLFIDIPATRSVTNLQNNIMVVCKVAYNLDIGIICIY